MSRENLYGISGAHQAKEESTGIETIQQPSQFRIASIPIERINTLPQPRQTFGNIDELANNIALRGLISPLIVARFSEEGCTQQLKAINELWETNCSLANLKAVVENGRAFYYILIAGERRLRALKQLQKTSSESGPGEPFEVGVSLCSDIPLEEYFYLQASENTYRPVPPAQEAWFYYNLFKALRRKNAKYPLAWFAREVGRSESTIRAALRFCELPPSVRDFVEKGVLVYGTAIQISRLRSVEGITDGELKWWTLRAVIEQSTVEEFRKKINRFLRDHNPNQTMFDIFTKQQERQQRRLFFRKVVEKETVRGLWGFLHYLKKVNSLFLEGELGTEYSPFSEGSPVRLFMELVSTEEAVLLHLRKFLSKIKAGEAEEIIGQTKEVLAQIEAERKDSQPIPRRATVFPSLLA